MRVKIPPYMTAEMTTPISCSHCGQPTTVTLGEIMAAFVATATWSGTVAANEGLKMSYQTSDELTNRTVIPQKLKGIILNGEKQVIEFEAFCLLRQASRTFIPAHVVEAFDMVTGERVENIAQWLMARYIA